MVRRSGPYLELRIRVCSRAGRSEIDVSLTRGPSHLRWGGGEGGNKNKKTQGGPGGPGGGRDEGLKRVVPALGSRRPLEVRLLIDGVWPSPTVDSPPCPPAPQPTNPQGRARRPMHRWHSAHCARSWALSHHVPGCARRVDTTLPYIAVTDV